MKVEAKTATIKGPAETFTGDVYLNMLHQQAGSHMSIAHVRFMPGSRTNWHSHPAGQTLQVTDGVGLVGTRDGTVHYIRPGDTIWTPPGEEHWHGGSADNVMCHLALTELADGEEPATWLEPVTDDQYRAANGHRVESGPERL